MQLTRRLMQPNVAASMALAASIVVFGLFPQIDLAFSQLFWSPDRGFVGERLDSVRAMYRITPWVGRLLLLGVVLTWLVGLVRPKWLTRHHRRSSALLLGAAVFGQGLLIDVALKDHWGRQRPRDTVAFDGALPFQPPLQPGGLCHSNCSFVSGHASTGFYLLGFGILAAPAQRRRWMLAALAVGSVLGLGRVAQGGHYLSDIVFSFFAVWLSTHAVWSALRALDRMRAARRLWLRQRPQWPAAATKRPQVSRRADS